jgi:hypothetical protein
MMKQLVLILASGALLSAQVLPPLGGQGGYGYGQDQIRRAEIRGGGGDGKCTIEVRVDGTAEVAILGDEARLRTLSGNPAQWVRFQCNQRMPTAPNDFRFKGIDGRGRQDLVQAGGGGRPAVIRIDDPKGGDEGYTFDVEWRGGSDAYGGGWGGYNDGYNDGNMRRRGNNGRWNGGNNGRWNDRDRDNYGWNRELSFRGRGDGYFRTNSGANDRLDNVDVNISRNGDVRASFRTDRRYDLTLTGRVTNVDRDLVLADVSGPGVRGVMEIRVDGNRVRDVFMRSNGRDNAELRWNSRN